MEGLIRFLRSHRWARRSLSVSSIVLLVAALGLLGYPAFTNWQHDRLQSRLRNNLKSEALAQSYRNRNLKDGDALTRIKIPALGVDTVVVEGTTPSALRAGAGHYPQTPLPCDAGNVAIAGHRTTYGKPFANIDQLKPGDSIILETPIGTCTYEVSKAPRPNPDLAAAYVVAPTDFSVIAQDPSKSELTLTSCHPKGSAAQRIIIRAEKVSGSATASG